MSRVLYASGLVALLAALLPTLASREPTSDTKPVRKEFGIDKRVPWTTSKVKGSPEPPNPYQLVKSYPKLVFNEPLELTPVPGKKAWVVAERRGKIYTFDS